MLINYYALLIIKDAKWNLNVYSKLFRCTFHYILGKLYKGTKILLTCLFNILLNK